MLDFSEALLQWYAENKRPLPWRENVTPYRVWVSEIMLQQTRIEAAKGYFLRFTEAFPDVFALAAADEDTVLKLWEGLGYYSRARNLHKTAKLLVEQYHGEFPRDYAQLRALPGVGEYTAGAIASLAFHACESAVDGNVMRVVSRLTCDTRSIAEQSFRREVRFELKKLMRSETAAEFTSALMELGETVCLPGTPECARCPLSALCQAHEAGEETLYPVMPEKKPRRVEERNVLLLLCGERVAVRRRGETGLLARLWEYPDGEAPEGAEKCGEAVHIFTHVEWHMTGYLLRVEQPLEPYRWVTREERAELAIPTAFRFYTKLLEKLGY